MEKGGKEECWKEWKGKLSKEWNRRLKDGKGKIITKRKKGIDMNR